MPPLARTKCGIPQNRNCISRGRVSFPQASYIGDASASRQGESYHDQIRQYGGKSRKVIYIITIHVCVDMGVWVRCGAHLIV